MKLSSLQSAVGFAALGMSLWAGPPAEVTRARFSKPELDSSGYPTNAILAADLGRSEARRDLSIGVVRLPMYGLPTVSTGEFNRILAERYHISRFGLGGCLVSESWLAYANGYSEVSRHFIEERHGTNLWQEVQAEAEMALNHPPEPGAGENTRKHRVASGTYRVRPGDTLARIAQRHSTTLKSLQAANPDVDPKRLKVHQELRLPAPTNPSEKP